MTPTNGQIIAEARRRAKEQNWRMDIEEYIIEVVRENWTQPEPGDPDVEAYWRWRKSVNPTGRLILNVSDAYLAGARMAREQERDLVRPLVDQAKATIDQQARLLDRLPPGMRTQLGIVGVKIMDATSSFYNTLSKYEDGGK